MTHILLTGAGFSRNWGGFLANEAFEYLLGSTHVDDGIRQRLWAGKEHKLGFEDVLAALQTSYGQQFNAQVEQDLRSLTSAVTAMFAEMAEAFDRVNLEGPHLQSPTTIHDFLKQFDAIYTLNQDTLIEQKYLGQSTPGATWRAAIPGLTDARTTIAIGQREFSLRTPLTDAFSIPSGIQPYIKLHGSFNWLVDRELLLILGGNKAANISKYPILTWYHQLFRADLEKPDARLMIIGYSFNDAHINNAIMSAIAKGNNLRIFIIDPLGVDVLDKRNPLAQIPQPLSEAPLLQTIAPQIVGASRRQLSSTFGNDVVENARVMRFFKR